MSDLPFLFPLGVVAGPNIFEFLSVSIESRTLNAPSVFDAFLSQEFPTRVVLDDVFNGPFVPLVVGSDPKLVPSEV